MFNMGERSKSKQKFGGTNVCKAEEVGEYFVNPKIKNVAFGQGIMQIKLFVLWISELLILYEWKYVVESNFEVPRFNVNPSVLCISKSNS